MPQSSWARAPRLLSLHSRVREPQLLRPLAAAAEAHAPGARAAQQGKPPQREARTLQPGPNAAKDEINKIK